MADKELERIKRMEYGGGMAAKDIQYLLKKIEALREEIAANPWHCCKCSPMMTCCKCIEAEAKD